MVEQYQMYIGGEWVESADGSHIDCVAPYSGEVWARVPGGTAADVDRAVRAAHAAYDETDWSRNPKLRAGLLTRLADELDKHADHIAGVESRDNGKTIREELGMNRALSSYYRFPASLAYTLAGDLPAGGNPDVLSMTQREPYGVVGIQTPWNTPGVLLAQMAGSALAAGNTIVVKPSEVAPCSLLEFARIVHSVGFPPGVINIVTGLGPVVGAALCEHPLVAKLTLTGGPEAGVLVASQAALRLVPVVMELGGKSASIVFEDADLDFVAAGLVAGFTGAGGQSCVAGTRALLHRSIHDAVVDRMLERVASLKMGDPANLDTDLGPMAMRAQVDRVTAYVEVGVAEGATKRIGGRGPEQEGTLFFPPVIFTDVKPDMRIAQEEIFGPVLSVIPFDDEDEAVRITNGTEYGLAAGVWTSNLDRAHRVARRIRAGTVWVNHYRRGDAAFPFGGYGHSGWGRVGGVDGFREMTRVKSIQILLG